MLAELERTYLQDPNSLEDKQKKNLNHRIKNKLTQINENLQDIKLILEKYPEERTKGYLSNDVVFTITAILERTLQILDPWPVGEHEEGGNYAFRVWGSAIPSSKPGECAIFSISRTASEEEDIFHSRLKEQLSKIQYFIDPCIPDPVCRNPEYIRIQEETAFQIVRERGVKTGNLHSVSLNAYLDETGVDEKGWVLRAPTAFPIETLKNMRWRPRGLKSCIELPPIFQEKKIPRGPEIAHWRIESNKEGTRYLVSEKGEPEKSVTLDEFLKLSKYFDNTPINVFLPSGDDGVEKESKP